MTIDMRWMLVVLVAVIANHGLGKSVKAVITVATPPPTTCSTFFNGSASSSSALPSSLKQQSLLGCGQVVVYTLNSAVSNISSPSLCGKVQLINNQQADVYGWQLVYRYSSTTFSAGSVDGAAVLITSGAGAPVRVVNSFSASNISGNGGTTAFQLATAANPAVADWQSTSSDWTAVFLNGAYCSKLPSSSFQLPDCETAVDSLSGSLGLGTPASQGSPGMPATLCYSIFCCGSGYQTQAYYGPSISPPTSTSRGSLSNSALTLTTAPANSTISTSLNSPRVTSPNTTLAPLYGSPSSQPGTIVSSATQNSRSNLTDVSSTADALASSIYDSLNSLAAKAAAANLTNGTTGSASIAGIISQFASTSANLPSLPPDVPGLMPDVDVIAGTTNSSSSGPGASASNSMDDVSEAGFNQLPNATDPAGALIPVYPPPAASAVLLPPPPPPSPPPFVPPAQPGITAPRSPAGKPDAGAEAPPNTGGVRDAGSGGGGKTNVGLIVGATAGALVVVVAAILLLSYRTSRQHNRLLQQIMQDSQALPHGPTMIAATLSGGGGSKRLDDAAASDCSVVPQLSNMSSLAVREVVTVGVTSSGGPGFRRGSRTGVGTGGGGGGGGGSSAAGSSIAGRSLSGGNQLMASLSNVAARSNALSTVPPDDEDAQDSTTPTRPAEYDPFQGVALSLLLRTNSMAAVTRDGSNWLQSTLVPRTASESYSYAACHTSQSLPLQHAGGSNAAVEHEAATPDAHPGASGEPRVLQGLSRLPLLFETDLGTTMPPEEPAGTASSVPFAVSNGGCPAGPGGSLEMVPPVLSILSESAVRMSSFGSEVRSGRGANRERSGGQAGRTDSASTHTMGAGYLTRQSTALITTSAMESTTSFSGLQSQAWVTIDFAKEIVLDRKLGQGAFGTVYAADWRGQRVAVKLVPLMLDSDTYAPKSMESIKQEIQVLSRLSHRNIIQFYGACLAPPHVCIVEELAVGGSLASRLHRRQPISNGSQLTTHASPLSYREVVQVGLDIASAMAYLHPGVVHRDLKPANVLLDGEGRALVCDFGIAKFKGRTFLSTKNVHAGTPAYMAPEQFEGRPVDEKVDLYAFAIILNECMTGKQPWLGLDHPMQAAALGQEHHKFKLRGVPSILADAFQIIFAVGVQGQRPALPADCPQCMVNLVTACWAEEPAERPSFKEVLQALQEEMLRIDAELTKPRVLRSSSVGLPVTGSGGSGQVMAEVACRVGSAIALHVFTGSGAGPADRPGAISAPTGSAAGSGDGGGGAAATGGGGRSAAGILKSLLGSGTSISGLLVGRLEGDVEMALAPAGGDGFRPAAGAEEQRQQPGHTSPSPVQVQTVGGTSSGRHSITRSASDAALCLGQSKGRGLLGCPMLDRCSCRAAERQTTI